MCILHKCLSFYSHQATSSGALCNFLQLNDCAFVKCLRYLTLIKYLRCLPRHTLSHSLTCLLLYQRKVTDRVAKRLTLTERLPASFIKEENWLAPRLRHRSMIHAPHRGQQMGVVRMERVGGWCGVGRGADAV